MPLACLAIRRLQRKSSLRQRCLRYFLPSDRQGKRYPRRGLILSKLSQKASDKTESQLARRCRSIVTELRKVYPDAGCALTHKNPLELLVATILSAQCTDARVNKVTPALFERYPEATDLAASQRAELEELVHTTGFFRNKAKAIQGAASRITNEFGGTVPSSMEELLTLPGVARKTANVVLGTAFTVAEGFVVDTHVFRLSHRMGLAKTKTPEQTERRLMELVPRKDWIDFAHILIHHGRNVCTARSAKCADCVVESLCPKIGVPEKKPGNNKAANPAEKPPPKERITEASRKK